MLELDPFRRTPFLRTAVTHQLAYYFYTDPSSDKEEGLEEF